MNKKTLRPSVRGLTFTTTMFQIGSHYRYILDLEKREILIIPAEEGMTVSRKKSGDSFKPLIDIRSAEVRALCKEADRLEVIDSGENIIVRAYKALKSVVFSQKAGLGVVEFEDVIGQEIGSIVLKKAAGGENHYGTDSMPEKWTETTGSSNSSPLVPVYDVISLFSGAGLLDYAFFKDPKFRIAFATDFDKEACETYRTNIGPILQKDIREVQSRDVPRGDVIIGGPCCQGFSNANRRNLDTDTSLKKRLLVHEYIRIVQAISPKIFVIENVPEMLTKDAGAHFKAVLEELEKYKIGYAKLLDSDLGGYSTRRRLVIIGSTTQKPAFSVIALNNHKTCSDALENVDESWSNWNDVTVSKPKTQEIMSYVPNGGNWKDVPESIHKFHPNTHADRYTRLDPDGLCPTIANWRKFILMPYHRKGTEQCIWNRILNVSEAAALMGLDKSFRFVGNLNAMQQQVANGVTQAMAQYIKNIVLSLLKEKPDGYQFTLKDFGFSV